MCQLLQICLKDILRARRDHIDILTNQHAFIESPKLKKKKNERETWFADDSENDTSQEDDSDSDEDAARDSEKHPPLQNYRFQSETHT